MLTKIVNGVEVQCTPEEETQIRAEWSSNEIFFTNQIAKQKTEAVAKESALAKLTALGLTADEVKALLGAK